LKKNYSLKSLNSFGIDVNADNFCSVESLSELLKFLKTKPSNLFILGGGSNILFTKNVEGTVLHINLKGIEVLKESNFFSEVKVSAGENWHDFVLWSIDKNLGGLENLSLIPGNVGTAPIQNIGAYGVELKDNFVSCEAVNLSTLEIETFTNLECKFRYRNSIFKSEKKGEYIIISVTFKLTNKNHKIKTSYGDIKKQLEKNSIKHPKIKDISDAVILIRKSKLPDPKVIGNAGSFFKNPIINSKTFSTIIKQFPNIPNYKISNDEIKIPAGWLIEKAGFKGKKFNTYGVHDKQALVLVNYGNASGKEILELSKLIQKTIITIFGIKLEREVNII